jgi:hypothetical protein
VSGKVEGTDLRRSVAEYGEPDPGPGLAPDKSGHGFSCIFLKFESKMRVIIYI